MNLSESIALILLFTIIQCLAYMYLIQFYNQIIVNFLFKLIFQIIHKKIFLEDS